jgi:DNA-binding NtrC family response regulator
MQDTVLIIDDEKKICSLLARIIELEGFKVFQAFTGREGLKILKAEDILVVVSDVKLPDYNGVELVKEIKMIRPSVEVINLTAFGTIADGVMAMRNGAFDYITKGDDNEKIIPLVYKAMDKAKLNSRVYDYLAEFTAKVNRPEFTINKEFARLLTTHNWKGSIRELKNVIERVLILADHEQISANLLPFEFHTEIRGADPLNMQDMEKQHIVKVLKYTRGNKTETSRLLGIGLTTLYRKIEEYKIDI